MAVKTLTRAKSTAKTTTTTRKPQTARSSPVGEVTLENVKDQRFDIPVNPAADLFPILSEDELAALAADIKANGLLEPIVMYKDALLDGRNRYLACKIAKVKPTFEEWRPGPGDFPSVFVMSRNLHRRHMTASQRATIAVKLERQIAAEAKAARDEARQEQKDAEAVAAALFSGVSAPKRRTVVTPPAPIPAGKTTPKSFTPPPAPKFTSGRARDIAAKTIGVSSGYVTDAKGLEAADPDLFAAVSRGDMTIPQAQEAHVRKQMAAGTLDQSPLRPAVKEKIKEKINAKQSAKTVRKFTKVVSSKVKVRVDIVFANRTVAEDWLTRMEEDKRVLELKFDPLK